MLQNILLILAGVFIGVALGIIIMCCLFINRDQ